METWQIISLVAIVAIIVAVLAIIRTRQKDIKKVAYMMDAMEDGELNFRFQDKNRFNRTLNRIRTIFEMQRQQHEQDSWTKLIRVLTHEIMNTVSPIASLSDALAKSVDENGHSELDVKAGLETISDSSKNGTGLKSSLGLSMWLTPSLSPSDTGLLPTVTMIRAFPRLL